MVKVIEQFSSGSFNYSWLGYSIKGSGKEENQDAFAFFYDDNCVIAVVADGLGSAIYSSHGAKVLCTTAIETLKKTESTSNLAIAMRNRWIDNLQHKPAACDTTLKFIKITNEKAVMGGIGDGWLAFLSGSEYISLSAENSFTNQTETIMSSDLLNKFIVEKISISEDGALFLIATDGFSEDIDKTQGKSFLENIGFSLDTDADEFCANLENTLDNWPVKTNSDDKTVVLLKRGVKA
jgi:serine/threonine protein phosphatase PrpC